MMNHILILYLLNTGRRESSTRRALAGMGPVPGQGLQQYMQANGSTLQTRTQRFGFAQGQPGSQERLLQCRQLERQRYPELRRLPSFMRYQVNPGDQEWRNYFLSMPQGTNIVQTLLARIAIENAPPLPGLSREQSKAVSVLPAPAGWAQGSRGWLYDTNATLQALSEWGQRTRQHALADPARHALCDNARERMRQVNLLPTSQDVAVVNMYNNAIINVRRNGRAHFSVYTGENQTQQRGGEALMIGTAYGIGQWCLDYDPTVSPHALVSTSIPNSYT